jgi:hypothetical protein
MRIEARAALLTGAASKLPYFSEAAAESIAALMAARAAAPLGAPLSASLLERYVAAPQAPLAADGLPRGFQTRAWVS